MKLTKYEINRIESKCEPLIGKFKSQYILKNPEKNYNYLVDIYLKQYRNYLYLCGKYKTEKPNRIENEFEEMFVRLKIIQKDSFDISYMRHTGKWFLIANGLTFDECLEMIEGTPTLHPIG
ncbi:MAG: hypothetical protein ABFS35_13960 [Bacteroidota bacterium]